MAITSANQLELLQTADAVAREKMIDPDLVIQAMEESLARAAKSRYGSELDIRVKIDRKTGRATFARIRTVVADEALENHHAQLTVGQAAAFLPDPGMPLGEWLPRPVIRVAVRVGADLLAVARAVEHGANGGAVPPGEDLGQDSHGLGA